jgi:hypothetical protein
MVRVCTLFSKVGVGASKRMLWFVVTLAIHSLRSLLRCNRFGKPKAQQVRATNTMTKANQCQYEVGSQHCRLHVRHIRIVARVCLLVGMHRCLPTTPCRHEFAMLQTSMAFYKQNVQAHRDRSCEVSAILQMSM